MSEVLVDSGTNKARGVRVIDANTREVMDFSARAVVLGAGTLESTKILLNSRSSAHPTGLGNSSGLLGCYLSEHIMGIRGSGYIPSRIGTETTLDDGRPVGPYIPRFRNITDRHPDFIRGYHFQGGGGSGEYPGIASDIPGYGKAFKSNVRKHYPALISFGGFGEVLPRKENRITLDPVVRDASGVPVIRFDYRFGDNERKMAKDMADTIEEMLIAAGAEDIKIGRELLPEGWSIHEIGTARMGDDPKTSVTDRFCRLHDVEERLHRRRRAVCLWRNAEHDVDDSRDGVAHHGLLERAKSGRGRYEEARSSSRRSPPPSRCRRLCATRAIAVGPAHFARPCSSRCCQRSSRTRSGSRSRARPASTASRCRRSRIADEAAEILGGVENHGIADSLGHERGPLAVSAVERAIRHRHQSVAGMETSFRNAALWGADAVLLVPAVVDATTSYRDAWTRSQPVIRERLLPLASQLKVIIAVEEVWNKFLLSPLEFARYVDEFESPWLKAYFDVGNVVFYGYPAGLDPRSLGARIVKVHLKDFHARPAERPLRLEKPRRR